MNWISLAIGLLRLLNWITTKISEEQWKQSGREEVFLAKSKEFNKRMEQVKDIVRDNEDLSPEERKKILMED